eukprot:10321451-Ditylum_brightwellii.AAC.1
MVTKYMNKEGGVMLGTKLSLFIDTIIVLITLCCGYTATLGTKLRYPNGFGMDHDADFGAGFPV